MLEKKQTNWVKQSSWFRTDANIDFENSFKFWFALMWQNKYIQIFLVAFALTITAICKFDFITETFEDNYANDGFLGGFATIAGCSIPPLICLIIAYKGFYQYFNDLKNGRSR